jgi:biotin synthase
MSSPVRSLLRDVAAGTLPDAESLERLLALEAGEAAELFRLADGVRRDHMGDGILLRGIVEFSNFCRNRCRYCGLNVQNGKLPRYRMTQDEILRGAAQIAAAGVATVVLQSGEEDGLDPEWLAGIIRQIKTRCGLVVTLSVGERAREEYRLWRAAGADRYLLKIETTDRALYASLHPGMNLDNRLRCLADLRALGYQVGSGIIVGLPGQTLASIAADIQFFREHDFDMIGIGPFIPHAATPLSGATAGNAQLTLTTVALTRIVTRNAHLPATTALGSLGKSDLRLEALKAGANVLMPNFTPQPYRKLYEIYPGKRCVSEPVGACAFCMEAMAASIGRTIDRSRGDSLKRLNG